MVETRSSKMGTAHPTFLEGLTLTWISREMGTRSFAALQDDRGRFRMIGDAQDDRKRSSTTRGAQDPLML